MKNLKLIAISIIALLFVSCAETEAYFPDSSVQCPVCKMYMSKEDFYDHNECEIYCCYCGDSIVDVAHYVPFYCNACAKKDYPEYFCHDCGSFYQNGLNLINNHCVNCYKKMLTIVNNYDFNAAQFDHTQNTFILFDNAESYSCSYCEDTLYSWDSLYDGNYCKDCAKIKHPELFCFDCNNCFIPSNLVANHCLTCLFDFKSKIIS